MIGGPQEGVAEVAARDERGDQVTGADAGRGDDDAGADVLPTRLAGVGGGRRPCGCVVLLSVVSAMTIKKCVKRADCGKGALR